MFPCRPTCMNVHFQHESRKGSSVRHLQQARGIGVEGTTRGLLRARVGIQTKLPSRRRQNLHYVKVRAGTVPFWGAELSLHVQTGMRWG